MNRHGTLPEGQIVLLGADKKPFTVDEFLDDGTQGEIYRISNGSVQLAFKWYGPHFATERQCEAIGQLIEKGPPNDSFLWPDAFVVIENMPGFGYAMPLRPAGYATIGDLLARRICPTSRV